MAKSSQSTDMTELLKRLRADRSNLFAGKTSDAEIRKLEEDLYVKLSPSYVAFLKEFDGGEFAFARMHCVTEDGAGWLDMRREFENFFRGWPMLAARKLVPFATVYSGAVICFDMLNVKNGEPALVRFERGEEPQHYFDSLPDWLAWHYNKFLEDADEIDIYLASRTQFDDIPLPTQSTELLEVDPDGLVARFFLNDSPTFYKYRIRFNEDEVIGAPELAHLAKFMEDVLVKTGESVEVLAYSNQEMSTDPKWATNLGPIKVLNYDVNLNAGDHYRMDRGGDVRRETDPKCELLKRAPLANHVVQDHHRCSFCKKGQSQVRKLIVGPDVFICDECVDTCAEIVQEEFVG